MLIVLSRFTGYGYDMPRPGTFIDPPEPARSELIAAGIAAEFEMKVTAEPDVKKNALSR